MYSIIHSKNYSFQDHLGPKASQDRTVNLVNLAARVRQAPKATTAFRKWAPSTNASSVQRDPLDHLDHVDQTVCPACKEFPDPLDQVDSRPHPANVDLKDQMDLKDHPAKRAQREPLELMEQAGKESRDQKDPQAHLDPLDPLDQQALALPMGLLVRPVRKDPLETLEPMEIQAAKDHLAHLAALDQMPTIVHAQNEPPESIRIKHISVIYFFYSQRFWSALLLLRFGNFFFMVIGTECVKQSFFWPLIT